MGYNIRGNKIYVTGTLNGTRYRLSTGMEATKENIINVSKNHKSILIDLVAKEDNNNGISEILDAIYREIGSWIVDYDICHDKKQYVYIVTNSAWEGWCKVGMASDINKRVKQYQTYSPFRDYSCENVFMTIDAVNVERLALQYIGMIAESNSNEWFMVDAKEASMIISKIISKLEVIYGNTNANT